jgi:putative acetyltransferase
LAMTTICSRVSFMSERESAIRQIRQHTRQLVRELDVLKGVYLDTGYTFTQCHVLFELSTRAQNLMSLSDNLLLDKSNTSRTVKKLVELGLVKVDKVTTDHRQKLFRLTAKGSQVLRSTISLANRQVEDALDNLSKPQQDLAIQGMHLYAIALQNSRLQADYSLCPIRKKDNSQVARLVRQVMTEFQAVGEGYSIVDPEVDDMYGNYRDKRSCYYVIVLDADVVGCGGIAPLKGGDQFTCELRKMFLLPTARGLGLGRRLLLLLMEQARKRGYQKCYLETLDRMSRANELYSRSGFELLDKPIGNTGHSSCDRWCVLEL